MKQPYSVSVIGGGRGGTLSIEAILKSDRLKLAAITDIRKETAEELSKKHGVPAYTNHVEMFQKSPTDILCISTYAPTHVPLAKEALKLPHLKGILLEKPVSDSAASAKLIADAIKKRNIPCNVPHGMLSLTRAAEIISRVKNGEIGKLLTYELIFGKWDLINAGIHWLNFFVNVTGNEPMEYVLAGADTSTQTYRDGMQVETSLTLFGKTKNGISLFTHCGDEVKSNVEGKGKVARIIGSEGMIELYGWDPVYRLVNAEHPKGIDIKPQQNGPSGHLFHLLQIADAIETGKTDYTSLDTSVTALEIIDAAYLSARHHCQVNFPIENFKIPTSKEWELGQPYKGTGGGRDGKKLLEATPK